MCFFIFWFKIWFTHDSHLHSNRKSCRSTVEFPKLHAQHADAGCRRWRNRFAVALVMVQLCSTMFNWFTKKTHDFGLELAEASMHAQVRKLGIQQIPEAGITDMNMIWIWYEYDMNMIWIWFEYDMNSWENQRIGIYHRISICFLNVHVVLCVWWCAAKDIEIIEINEFENFIMFGPNCSASRA